MEIKWKAKNKKLKPEIILDKIDSIKLLKDGNLSYPMHDHHNATTSLYSMLDIPAHYSTYDIYPIVHKALNIVALNDKLTSSNVMEKINELVKQEMSVRENTYHFLTSLSIANDILFSQINIENATIIKCDTNYPKKFSSRNKAIIDIELGLATQHPQYTKIIVKTKSNTPNSAVEKSLRSLDIMRAILSFYTNSRMEYAGNLYSPINTIRLGEAHTLHHDKGNIVDNPIWYEPNFIETPIFTLNKSQIELLKKNFKRFKLKLSQCRYSNTLKDALLRYVRALDEKDSNTAFIKLWGALEILTIPSIGNNDNTVKRCSFLFQEAIYHKQILEHLREYRNRSIHAGEQTEIAKTHCYQLQYYFQTLMRFHLRNINEFSSLNEANEFLDFPDDSAGLKKQQKLIKKALVYRNI